MLVCGQALQFGWRPSDQRDNSTASGNPIAHTRVSFRLRLARLHLISPKWRTYQVEACHHKPRLAGCFWSADQYCLVFRRCYSAYGKKTRRNAIGHFEFALETRCWYNSPLFWQSRRELEAKCVSLLFLGFLLGTRRSAIGNSPRSLCESGNLDSEFQQRRFRSSHVNRKWSFCTLRPWFWTNSWTYGLFKNKDT